MTRISAPASRARCAKSPVPSTAGVAIPQQENARRMRRCHRHGFFDQPGVEHAKGMSARVIVEALQIELSHDTLPGNSTEAGFPIGARLCDRAHDETLEGQREQKLHLCAGCQHVPQIARRLHARHRRDNDLPVQVPSLRARLRSLVRRRVRLQPETGAISGSVHQEDDLKMQKPPRNWCRANQALRSVPMTVQ